MGRACHSDKYSYNKYIKVKVPLTDSNAQRGGFRGILVALHFVDLGARRGWVVSTTPRPLYPQERPGTYCTGGWVGPKTGLDMCEKSRLYRGSIPGPSNPWPVAIPTELSRPQQIYRV
jgi:hypothetical protein